MGDLEKLQEAADDLHSAAAKFEKMGLSDAFDGLIEAAENIKNAGNDAREFRKTAIFSTIITSALACAVASYFVIDYAIDAKITKLEKNQNALELLSKFDYSITTDPKIDKKTGQKVLAFSSPNGFALSEDGHTAYLLIRH